MRQGASIQKSSATEEVTLLLVIAVRAMVAEPPRGNSAGVTKGQGSVPSGRFLLLFAAAVAALFFGQIEGGVGPGDHLFDAVEGTLAGADPDTDGEGYLKGVCQIGRAHV